mgnify:CR=1 FL=1
MNLRYGILRPIRNPHFKFLHWQDINRNQLHLIVESEAMGYDNAWLTEHHFVDDGYSPSLLPIAGAVAARTSRIRIGTFLILLPLHNPVRIAEDTATVDLMSNGRFDLGVGLGYRVKEFADQGVSPTERGARLQEGIGLIQRLLSDEEVTFEGKFSQLNKIQIVPPALQKPHPPIWVPGGGSVETWRWCAEMEYVYCYLSYYGYQAAKATMHGFWEEMDRLGKDRNPYRAGFLQFVGVAETESLARELYAEPAEYFYDRCLRVSAKYANPPGYVTEATQRAGVKSQISAAAAGGPNDVSNTSALPGIQKAQSINEVRKNGFDKNAREFDSIVENGYVIIGSPSQVAEQLREIVHDLHFGQLMLLLQYGNMTKKIANYNTQLYAEKVMPQLSDVWSESVSYTHLTLPTKA